MRWPFNLFGRSRSEAAPAETPAAVPRASGHDWVGLPPIQRSVGDAPLTAASGPFAAGLPGTVGVPLALQPLGHARTAEAPSGLVRGLTSTYQGPERLVYVQRRAAGGGQLQRFSWPEWGGEPAAPAAAPPAPEAADVAPAVETLPAGEAPAAVETTAAEEAAAAPATAAAEPAAPAFEAAPLPPPPAPRAVRAVAAAPPPPVLTVSTLPEAALPFAPVVGSRPAPVEPVAAPPPAESPSLQRLPAESGPASRRLSVGQSRRLGLGMPFVPSRQPVAQRSVDEEPEAPAASAEQAPMPAPPTPPAPPSAGAAEDEPPVQRRIDAPPVAPSPLPGPVVSHAPLTTAPARPPDASAELSRPIFRVQRRAPGARPDAPPTRGPEPPLPMPVVSEARPVPAGAEPVPTSGPAGPAPAVPPVQRAIDVPPAAVAPAAAAEVVVPSAPVVDTPPGPAPLPVVPVQRLEVGEQEDDEQASTAQTMPLTVVPAQRIETGSEPPGLATGPLPVVPVQRAEAAAPGAPPIDFGSTAEAETVEESAAPPVEPGPAPAPETEAGTIEDTEPLVAAPVQRLEAGSPALDVVRPLPLVPGAAVRREAPVGDQPAVLASDPSPGPGGPAASLAGGAAPLAVSRRPAGTPVPAIMPLVGNRPLPVSAGAPGPAPAAAGQAVEDGAAPSLTVLPALAEPVQRFDQTPADPAQAWPPAATTEAATAALAPVARVARPVAQAMAAAPTLALPAPELSYLPVGTARHSEELIAQRAAEAQQYISIEVPVQRAEESSDTSTSTTGTATSSGATPAAGGAPQHSDKELDDLARQLYERLRSRLRQELLVDRERAGLITDLRG